MNSLVLLSQETSECHRLAADWCAQEGTWLLSQAPHPHNARRKPRADAHCPLGPP